MCAQKNKYFTVSEALQDVLDESCGRDDEELWDDDDELMESAHEPVLTTSLSQLPAITLDTAAQQRDVVVPLVYDSATFPACAINESLAIPSSPAVSSISPPTSSTPKPFDHYLTAPLSKRPRLVSNSLLESEELDAIHVQIFTSDLDASSLAETYVSNPSTLTSVHDSVGISGDASSEPTSIEYVGAKLSKGCKCSQNCFGKLNISETEIYAHRLNVAEVSTAERDMLVMATIEAGVHQAKNSSRRKVTYRYHNTEVGIDTFLFIYAISGN